MSSRRVFFSLLLVTLGCTSATEPAGPDRGERGADNQSPAAGSAAAGRPKIGVSLLSFQNPFFKTISDNLERDAARHGFDVIALSADDDVSKQANQIKDFVVQKVAAIVLSPVDSKIVVPIIQEANAAAIPVFTVDIPCRQPGVKIVSQIATDNKSGGREAARAVIETLHGRPGKVAIVHYPTAESCVLRVAGFREVIDEHNAGKDTNPIEIVAELDGGGKKEIGYKAGEDLVQSHPDLDAIFAINDPSALGVVAALERANKLQQIAVIGFDGQKEGKQAIKDGRIYADPIQFPARMGQEAARQIVAYLQGEDVPPEILIPTQLYRRADAEQDPELD